ncbi:MAG: HD domain-containing protein [Oligoflexia bacterium]|nr:HD domain-containing protein [Oligoflexia bacterium]
MPKSRNIEDFVSGNLADLKAGEPLPCDIHLYFPQSMHLMLWRTAGDLVTDAFLEKNRAKGIEKFWVYRGDSERYEAYVNPPQARESVTAPAHTIEVLGQHIGETLGTAELPEEAKAERIGNLAQEMLRQSAQPDSHRTQNLTNLALREAVSELLEDLLDRTGQTARHQIAEIWKLASADPDFEHAANVSTFAVLFAMAFGRIDAELLADLALAGLLHDIGMTQLDAHLAGKAWNTFKPEEQRAYAAHVSASLELIQQFAPEIPARVKTLISQHHEKFDGSGYPRKLNGFQIDDVAQLLAMADILDSFASGQWDGSRRTLKETFAMLEGLEQARTFPEYFNPDVFSAVISWIRSAAAADARKSALNLVETQAAQLLKESVKEAA